MVEPLPKDNRCSRCGEWFHNAHACPVQRPASPPAPAVQAEGAVAVRICDEVAARLWADDSKHQQTAGAFACAVAIRRALPPPVVQQAPVDQPAAGDRSLTPDEIGQLRARYQSGSIGSFVELVREIERATGVSAVQQAPVQPAGAVTMPDLPEPSYAVNNVERRYYTTDQMRERDAQWVKWINSALATPQPAWGSTPQPAAQNAVSDEQIDAVGAQFYGNCYTPADRQFAKQVLALATQAEPAVKEGK